MGVRQFTGHCSGRELRPTSISELSKGCFSPPLALFPRTFDTPVSEERVARGHPGHSSTDRRRPSPSPLLSVRPRSVGAPASRDEESRLRASQLGATSDGAGRCRDQTVGRAPGTSVSQPLLRARAESSPPHGRFHHRWSRRAAGVTRLKMAVGRPPCRPIFILDGRGQPRG